MFKTLRAAPKAKQLTNSILSLNTSLVNQLILTGHRIKLEDSIGILQRNFTLLMFSFALSNPGANRGVWARVEELTLINLEDWLVNDLNRQGLVGDNKATIREVILQFSGSVKPFQTHLYNSYPEYLGQGIEPWLRVAVTEYSNELSSFFTNEFDFRPDSFKTPSIPDAAERANMIREFARQHVEKLTGFSVNLT